ncbi:M50 family metallopeptidase [Phytohabitans kaempferiae]|uniref:M50 family metallopeptidase n=1 Tax=Phytohabitans kaempferiae TaxID=1620943 RepID=A0ABV6MAP9_9ACTN
MRATDPPTGLVFGTLLLGLLAALFWPVTRYLITIAHEGSHALFGSVTGGTVDSVTVNADSTGLTGIFTSRPFIPALAGYVGPSLFGIVGAMMLAAGARPDAVLWVAVVLLAVILLQMRNAFGVLAVVVAGFFLVMLVHNASPDLRAVCAYTLVWFLLLGGFFSALQWNRRSVGWSSDAGILRELTRLPMGFWGILWWLLTLAALIYGGGILFGAIGAPGSAGGA